MESVVELGARLLAEREAAERAMQDQADAEAREEQLLAVGTANIVELLSAVLTRLCALEEQVADTHRQVSLGRVRRPVRDEAGTILYVVDELMAPALPAEPDGDD